jgi:CheY-like chemotaxis protein
MMPGMTGFEVLRRLRSSEQTKSLPVIVYSAMDEPAAVDEIKRLGVQDFIRKGAAVVEICEAVMRLKLA